MRLWYDVYDRDLQAPTDEVQQDTFDTGHEVGRLACERFPGGIAIDWDHLHSREAITETAELMRQEDVPAIFEAAFEFDGVLCRVDILERLATGGWCLIEVKSSSQCKDVHVLDVAVQLWILQNLDVAVQAAGVLTLNRDYTLKDSGLDVNQLFLFHDRYEQAQRMLQSVEEDIANMKSMLAAKSAPDIKPGPQCHSPYPCPFWLHCTRNLRLPDHPIGELPNIRQGKLSELSEQGIEEIGDIPRDFPLNRMQSIIRTSVTEGCDYVDPELSNAIKQLDEPIWHLDFETMSRAIPRFVGTRPYEVIPFMFSIHREVSGAKHLHMDHLHETSDDPRLAVAEHLIEALGSQGSICVYSSYEKTCINILIRSVPHLKQPLIALRTRLVDLCSIVKKHYYHPEFHGSFSLKSVLPVVSDVDYSDLHIDHGQLAAVRYKNALQLVDDSDKKRIFSDLRDYCARDTLAMIEVVAALRRLAARSSS